MKRIALLVLPWSFAMAAASPKEALLLSGRAVETFWEQFSAINCAESVSQVKLNENGKPVLRRESVYDYVVMMRAADEDIGVEESRMPVRASKDKDTPLLVTNGFSTLLFIFHPYFQNSYEYSAAREDSLEGRRSLRIQFRHIHNSRSPSCLRLRGRDYPIEWMGDAWVDPDSGAILKIAAELESSMEDLGLKSLRAEVRYAPVRFAEAGEQYLPAVATIEAETPRQHWRNVHRFTNYRRFTVSTKTKTESPR